MTTSSIGDSSDSSAGPLVDGVDQGKPTGESTIGEGSQEELP
jgi:hypothetical protein